ncbi:ferrochelatase [Ancylomarina sp. 16SWW S1-10-2]|uniref:ferrochelatase n=1 Tax=Ancylomarina sp. 16SWW S1-10-2 TaxID=2499681 RepID=UPI0012AD3303|nr:ferrochelatase [Ancylomarina sp. 16SWW S1-10-2]MRT91368.1 ferrochelatase [Ancylomarina sp. 16SWW S1-10-2]
MNKKTTVLLINLGTPKSPSVKDVRSYLKEFLNDKRVIDIPWLIRKILVNLIIIPFRTKNSSKIYKKLWTPEGSPLLIYGESVKKMLQEELGNDYKVELAMRYNEPSLPSVLSKIKAEMPERLIVFPMYPQYASSSTGSTIERVMELMKSWEVIPEVNIINQFFEDPDYINIIANNARKHKLEEFEHFVFSFHGLPIRQINKVHPQRNCKTCDCDKKFNRETDYYCYKATCYENARLIAEKLNIPKEKYTVGFQSRLDKNWLEPFADKLIVKLAKEGKKNIMVFSPAFVADCLETTVEIGGEFTDLFKENNGEKLVLVESLNNNPAWIKTIKKLVLNQ